MRVRLPRRGFILSGAALLGLFAASVGSPAHAGTFVFVTPSVSSTSGPVNAEADFSVVAGTITITLKDLQANPTDVAQLLSDLHFTVDNASSLTGASLSTSSGQEITVNSNGTSSTGSSVATGWVPTLSGTSGVLDVLAGGGAGPSHLIIGPPGGGGTYSNANGSIAGNGPHNPFLNQSASFTITGPTTGITANTSITSASFSFGTTDGQLVIPGQLVPEPSSLALGMVGLGIVSAIVMLRRRRQS